MSWYAAILLPQFPLQAVLRLREERQVEPIAVVEGGTEKGRVLEMTGTAAASGVLRGMASTQALARCPALRIWPRSAAQEQIVSALLLEVAGTLSPLIEATGEGLCLVDLRLVKECDWREWGHRVLERFTSLQLRVRIGVASNPDLAALAATRAEPVLVVQHPGTFLADVAVAEVDAPPDLIAVLRDWGIGHLGDLARLSRGEVIERLGPEAGTLWERAAGRAQRELRLVRRRAQCETNSGIGLPVRNRIRNPLLVRQTGIDFVWDHSIRPAELRACNANRAQSNIFGRALLQILNGSQNNVTFENRLAVHVRVKQWLLRESGSIHQGSSSNRARSQLTMN